MRNDARPIGEAASHDHRSPIPHDQPADAPPSDARDSVTHDRQSHVVNRGADENARRGDADADPVMPAGDSTIRTRI
jgi:hypothetical protein